MTKYRIVTGHGEWKFVVQRGFWFIWWDVMSFSILQDAERYMDKEIKKRDFKSEVIRSE